jgi:hypothetical protein
MAGEIKKDEDYFDLLIGRIMVGMEGKETEPVAFPIGQASKTLPETEAVQSVSFRTASGQDKLPLQAAIGIYLIPIHSH